MRFWFLILLCLLYNKLTIGQQDSDRLANYFLLGLDYASNTNTFGVTPNDIKQPNYLFTGSYLSKHNFDITYAAVVTDNADSSFSKPAFEHNLGIGYLYEFSKKFMLYSSYTHLVHSENSYALKSVYTDIAQIDALFYTKYYNGSLSISHLWGNKNMFYISAQNALDISIEKLFHKDGLLNIQLGMSINISDNNYYNKMLYESMDYEEFISWVISSFSERQALSIFRAIRENGYENTRQLLYDTNNDCFDPNYKITTIDFFVPLYYSINNLILSATSFFTIPTASSDFYDQSTSFQFMGGVSYFFEL